MLFESVAFAMGTPQAGGAAPSGGDMLMQFVPLILMFAIFWFLLIRPQQKRAKAHKQMLAELKRGDHVMTSSGLIGRIMEISEEEVVIECGDAKLRMSRGAIGGLVGKSAEKAEVKAEEKAPKAKKSHTAKPKKPSIRAQLDAAKKEQSKQTPPREKTKELEV